jgi:alpha-beta hydrolase superfamily lysophospholipase
MAEVTAWLIVWSLFPSISAILSRDDSVAISMSVPSSSSQRTLFGAKRTIDVPDDVFLTETEIEKLEARLPSHKHGWFNSSCENAQLHYRQFLPPDDTAVKAVVIFMHGVSTHSGKALNVGDRKLNTALIAGKLLANQFAFYAFDLYGHGYSDGTRFFISQYQDNVADLLKFCSMVKEWHPETPLFLMGESYGCTLTLHVANQLQSTTTTTTATNDPSVVALDSLILTAPAIIGDLPPRPVVKFLTFLARFYPKWRPFFMPNPISADRIWRDSDVLKQTTDRRFSQCGLDGSGIPFRLGTGVSLLRALEDVRTTVIPQIRSPFLILHGTDDYGVPISGSEFLWEHAATDGTERKFLKKEGAYHDLFADPLAEECVQDILFWIHHRLEERAKQANSQNLAS